MAAIAASTAAQDSPSPTKAVATAAATTDAKSASVESTSKEEVQSSKKPSSKASPHSNQAAAATPDLATPTGDSTSATLSPAAAAASASSSASSVPSSSSGGLSPGGKAGLAIGILLIVGLLAGLAFIFYRRKQRRDSAESYEKTDDEKSAMAAGLARQQSNASTRTAATAPRLSLRPVTQFLPELAARGKAANAVAGAGLHDSSIASAAAMARSHENEKANPFGDHAATQQQQQQQQQHLNRISDKSAGLPIQNNATENPFGNHAEIPSTNGTKNPTGDMPAPLRVRTPTPEGVAAAAGAGGLAGVAAVAAVKGAQRDNAPKALNLTPNRSTSPPSTSPASSDFSQTPASPSTMSSGAPPPSNVHRIQLDFKPSMDDELALRAGDLVRLLHEYDDGWVC